MPKLNTYGIAAYTFVSVCEKIIQQFLSSVKKMHTKENWFLFFCLTVYKAVIALLCRFFSLLQTFVYVHSESQIPLRCPACDQLASLSQTASEQDSVMEYGLRRPATYRDSSNLSAKPVLRRGLHPG